MNKGQELDMMILKSQLKTQKLMEKHLMSWEGAQQREKGKLKQYQQEEGLIVEGEDGSREKLQ